MLPFVPWSRHLLAADDPTLAHRVARGDREALASVYARHAGPVYRYALALCGNASWAADATQDAFVGFALRPLGYDAAAGPLGAYLAGMARHTLLGLWRAAGRLVAEDESAADDGPDVPAAEDPQSLLVRRQDEAALHAAIQALPWPLREALVLVDLQERPYAEAARIAGVELNTLRTRLHRARARLAVLLDPVPARDGVPE